MKKEAESVRNYRMRFHILLAILGLALFSSNIYGQTSAATIAGTVTDPTGAVVPNAKVTLTNEANGFVRTTTTNGTGYYSAPALEVGQYDIQVEAPGFKTYEQKGITLNVSTMVRTDVKLQLGTVGQSVTVEANALQVQADTSDVSQTITAKQIANIDTNGRNILQLTLLVPGAASNMPDFDLPGAQFQNRSIQFNGMRQDDNNWQIDGGEAYDRGGGGIMLVSPSQDAIGEFKIQTSNFSADEGNSSGGMTSMELKSGSKQYHGAAWEYNRNDALDAFSYLSRRQANPTKPELRYNAYGFNFGGPLKPRSTNPKTFFFGNMEWRYLVQGGSLFHQVPTAAQYGGNMNGFGTQIYVPNTTDPNAIAKFANDGLAPNQPFPNNTIPANLIDPSVAAYLKAGYMLTPNASDGIHYFSSANTSTPYREEIGRIDHQFNERLRLMGSLIWDNVNQIAPIVAWTGNTFPTIGSMETVPSWQGTVHLTDSISPNLLNEVAYTTNGNNITIANSGLWKTPSGFNTTPLFASANTINKVPGMDFSTPQYSVSMDNGNWPWQNWWRSNTWYDNISYIHGKHSFKFGVEYQYTGKKQQIFTDTAGTYHFYGEATVCPGVVCGSNPTPGVGLADMLLGYANDFGQAQNQDFVNIINNRYDAFGMDDWRVTPRLTLNLGLRWEGLPHAYDQNDRLSNFYPVLWNPTQAAQFVPGTNGVLNSSGPGFTKVPGVLLSSDVFFMNGIGLAGKNGIPRGLTTSHMDNIGPRVGFEYDLFGDGRTILRGGGGVYFEENAGNEEYNMGANVPFSNSSSTSQPYVQTPGTSWLNGAGAGTSPATPQGFSGVQPNLPITDVYQFNLGVQHQLRSNMVMNLAFVGNTSAHLSYGFNPNVVPQNDPDLGYLCGSICGYTSTDPTKTNSNYHRLYQGWGGMTIVTDEGNSHYEGLQATIRASAWHGVSVDLAYTYSHTWDLIDGQLFSSVDNPYDPGYQYGTAGFDRRQMAVANFVYEMPFFQHSGAVARSVLGGWELSGVGSMTSGNPISIGAYNPTGLSLTDHPNQSGPVSYLHTAQHWFNPNVFSEPAPFTLGNTNKNEVKGPGRDSWQFALRKDFHFTERTGFQFQASAFNAFNHTQFTGINSGVLTGNSANPYSATSGEVNGTADPRVFQLGAKAYF